MSEKINKEIFNAVNENLSALEQLFPAVVKDGQVDFDALKIELGKFEEAGTGVGTEKYEFVWNGKAKAKAEAVRDISGRTLKRKLDDGVDEDTTQNLYIEGDNLEALKLLRNSYYNRIKMIYIDPPYNTGNDFVYRDNFSMTEDELRAVEEESGNIDAEGNRLVKNSKDAAKYHTNWCNMIYPRLKIARDLLTDDGVIFISIDDSEQANLRKICDEVFGANNFIAQLIWQRAFSPKNDARFISNSHDYVFMYAKNIEFFDIGRLPRTEEANERYSNPDNDPRGDWMSSDISVKTYNAQYDFPITTPTGRVVEPPSGRCWRTNKEKILELIADNRIWFGPDGNGTPRIKRFLTELKFEGMAPISIMFHKEVGHSQEGSQEVTKLLDAGVFDGPKPVRLLRRLLTLANLSKDDIILDFFSGSASMAHSVIQLNAEEGGNRKYIMVQYPEKTSVDTEAYKAGYKDICEIGKARIKKAGQKIADENRLTAPNLDVGFKVFKVEDTNIRLFKSEMDGEPLTIEKFIGDDQERLDFNAGYTDLDVVYELLIRHRGIPLTAKIDKLYAIGDRTFVIADTIVVCLEQKLDKSMIAKLAAIDPAPIKYIFRDSAFGDDINLKTNTMQELTALIEKKNDGKKKALKVEFI